MSNKKSPNPDDKRIGNNVRAIRLQRGWSQTKLGDSLDLTFQQVQKYEKGTNRIGGSRLIQIAKALDVTPATILGSGANKGDDLDALLGMVNTNDAAKMLRAFREIEDVTAREALIMLAEWMAGFRAPRKKDEASR